MTILTIQPSGKDNCLVSTNPTGNYDSEIYLASENSDTVVLHSPLEFSLAGLPAGATIISATLMLYYYYYYNTDPVGRTHSAYRLTRTDWVELESTWNIYKIGSDWTTPGGDYTPDDGASTPIPADYGWMSWNVLAQIEYAQTEEIAAEFLILDPAPSGATRYGVYFYSNNYAVDTDLCPKLIIEYTVPTVGRSFGFIIG